MFWFVLIVTCVEHLSYLCSYEKFKKFKNVSFIISKVLLIASLTVLKKIFNLRNKLIHSANFFKP